MKKINFESQQHFDVLWFGYRVAFPKIVSDSLDSLETCISLGRKIKEISKEEAKTGDDTYRIVIVNELILEDAEVKMMIRMLETRGIPWSFTLGEYLVEMLKELKNASNK